MSADQKLQSTCKEWRRLAETEGEAIRAGDWQLVADCQQALQRLQSQIPACLQGAQEEWARLGTERTGREHSFRGMVAELIEIERRNSAALSAVQQAARTQFSRLEQTGRTLRQLQRSYAPPPAPGWTSYS
jgi:hypothetical protein